MVDCELAVVSVELMVVAAVVEEAMLDRTVFVAILSSLPCNHGNYPVGILSCSCLVHHRTRKNFHYISADVPAASFWVASPWLGWV